MGQTVAMGERQGKLAQRLLVFAAPAVATMLVASCATFSEPVSVPVKNDLAQNVTLAVCDSDDCSKRLEPWVLKPGKTGAVNVEVNGGYDPAILLDSGRKIIGCLPFRVSRRPSRDTPLTVKASDAVPCGSSGGVAAAHGKDWPVLGP